MDKKEKLLDIRDKVINFNKYILEYGYNEDSEIFINKKLDAFLEFIDKYEKEIKNEKG